MASAPRGKTMSTTYGLEAVEVSDGVVTLSGSGLTVASAASRTKRASPCTQG